MDQCVIVQFGLCWNIESVFSAVNDLQQRNKLKESAGEVQRTGKSASQQLSQPQLSANNKAFTQCSVILLKKRPVLTLFSTRCQVCEYFLGTSQILCLDTSVLAS